jgi:tRNA (adenine57-N1/adenine58-N1)-methyltransferase
VSLLDIHVSPRNEENEFQPPTEVLEAGTGHGALTLYLARAIHAANPPLPTEPVPKLFPTREQQAVWEAELNPTTDQVSAPVTNKAPPSQEDLHRRQAVIELGIEWKKRRGAIVHTIDNIPLHSLHAEKIVQSFGRGMYSGDVDFYTGNVGDWIVQQQKERFGESEHTSDKAFLTHIVLDLPGTHLYVERASSALTVDGNLLVFNPNVTQLVDCVKIIREKKLPLVLDRVVELGPGMSGGREWEIRSVLPRAAVKAQRERNGPDAIEPLEESTEIAGDVPQESPIADSSQSSAVGERDDSWQVICRPKFGARVVVGGFVGVWRKMSYRL